MLYIRVIQSAPTAVAGDGAGDFAADFPATVMVSMLKIMSAQMAVVWEIAISGLGFELGLFFPCFLGDDLGVAPLFLRAVGRVCIWRCGEA